MNLHSDFVITAALRFDGYRYQHWTGVSLADLTDRVEHSLEVLDDEFGNFAAFFALQRGLGKWGGEMTLPTSWAHKAFWILFFHLARRPTPAAYVFPEYQEKWERIYAPNLSSYIERFRAQWKRFLKLERDLASAGATITKSGAILMPQGTNWPTDGRWCFMPNVFTWKPAVYPALGNDFEEGLGQWRELSKDECLKFRTESALLPIRRYFDFYTSFLRSVRRWDENISSNSKAVNGQQRFTLTEGRWYAAEFIGDDFGSLVRSYSPIKVSTVRPFLSGERTFELGFYHANYPEGVRDKVYRLRTIERANHFLLAVSVEDKPSRYLLIYDAGWDWLQTHFGVKPESERSVESWLERMAGAS